MLSVLILYISGGTYSLKPTLNMRFLRNFPWQFYLRLEFLPEICWEEIIEERDLQFKADSKREIFEKLSMAILFTLRVLARNLMSNSHRRNLLSFFIFHFIGDGVWTMVSRVINQILTTRLRRHYIYCYANRNNIRSQIIYNTRHKYTLTNTSDTFQVNHQQQWWEKKG